MGRRKGRLHRHAGRGTSSRCSTVTFMTRIAGAQRRRGHPLAEDAEIAWQEACRAAEDLLSNPQPGQGELADRESLYATPVVQTTSATGEDARASSPAAADSDRGRFRTELGALVERVFNVPPFGAGTKCAMFCSAESNGADALTAAIADTLG